MDKKRKLMPYCCIDTIGHFCFSSRINEELNNKKQLIITVRIELDGVMDE
jgi:hypothetical protein